MSQFDLEYQKLNPAQQLAVDSIEGPVMVIAGAGTGKTQTIALRIARILISTQTPPSSILCLTFTDSASQNMRQRLLSIIGPAAYSVKIYTFHSFCNEIILSHPQYFIFAPNAQNLDELEKIEIIKSLIEKLPHQSTLKPWGDHYFYQKDIISSIQTLKRENVSPQTLEDLITQTEDFLQKSDTVYQQLKALRASKKLDSEISTLVPQLPPNPLISYHLSLYQSGGYDVGPAKSSAVNFKNALIHLFESLQKDLLKQKDLVEIYRNYQQELINRGRYDFDDMILFVLNSFKKHPELLLEYQEKFQYILVDEYQDTNSSQNKIIEMLGQYFDNPNIFVVGDDDQSIFRFQGASVENIYSFYQKYHPKLVVLKNNYRSHQLILDSSKSVINRNQNRLASYIKDVDKTLISVQSVDPDPINLVESPTLIEENYYVANKIQQLISSGVSPSQIAVLYRNHADVLDLSQMLSHLKISYYLPQDQDILKCPPIIQLIKLLEFIANPTLGQNVYPILASDFVNLNSLDLLKITRASATTGTPLFQLISDKNILASLNLSENTLKKLHHFHLRLAKSQKKLNNLTLTHFFNYVIRKFKYLNYCLKNPQYLSYLLTFYDQLKQLSSERSYQLADLLVRLQQLSVNNIPLPCPSQISIQQDSVNLMTVHKAKGLEFEHVFLIKVVDKKWGNNRDMNQLHLPPGILKYEIATKLNDSNEDERRLFYVALTRAKSQIYISYSGTPSQFIYEIDPTKIEKINLPPDSYQKALSTTFVLTPPKLSSSFADYLSHYLKNEYKFNVTHLNSYLRCPFCFYHQTILRLPAVKDKFSSYGTAVHHALSLLYSQKPSLELILDDYKKSLLKEGLSKSDFEESLSRGIDTLTQYLNHYQDSILPNNIVDYDFKRDNVFLDKIPLTGKIDLIEVYDHDHVNVVDFKTGNPDSKYKELSPDGDYFRQLVFYKLLSELNPQFKYQIKKGIIDFVQPSKLKKTFIRKDFDITDEHLEKLKAQITEVYQKILSLDFYHLGPDCKDNIGLHYLLKA